jgi:hypothetical protein
VRRQRGEGKELFGSQDGRLRLYEGGQTDEVEGNGAVPGLSIPRLGEGGGRSYRRSELSIPGVPWPISRLGGTR